VTTTARFIDGSFPDYERVIPRGPFKLKEPAQFNAEYLASFQKAGNIIEKSDTRVPMISHNGAENPAFVNFLPTGLIQGFGVIMPVRVQKSLATDLPEWIDAERQTIEQTPVVAAKPTRNRSAKKEPA
jgi:hypothetical protein